MEIEVVKTAIEHRMILTNLLELYAYDFSEFCDFDIGSDGLYGYEHLPLYWTDPNRYPHLIYVDGKLAGFVLIQKGSSVVEGEDVWDITEFFVLRKYRRKNIGSVAALDVWNRFKGQWQVRVLSENKRAQAFWSQAVDQFTGKKNIPMNVEVKDKLWAVYRFDSK